MAIKQSLWAKNQLSPPRPQTYGAVHIARFVHEFTEAVASTDILDLGLLPAGAYLVDAAVVTEGTFTGITGDIGIMSGEPGSLDPARTSDDTIFADVDLATANTAIQRLANPAAFLIAPSDKHRSIGLKVSGNVAAATGKKIHLHVRYAQ